MARPLKQPDARRTIVVRVRLTATEKKYLQDAAATDGLTLSDFLRVHALHALPRRRKPTPERAAFIQALAELGKLGSNLNQIARALNRREPFAAVRNVHAEVIDRAVSGVDTLSHHLLNMLEHGH